MSGPSTVGWLTYGGRGALGLTSAQAPSEAEAQCAAMCEAGLVHIVSTEDMDVLTFNTPRVVRNLMSPASQKKLILEFDTAMVNDRP